MRIADPHLARNIAGSDFAGHWMHLTPKCMSDVSIALSDYCSHRITFLIDGWAALGP